MTINFKGNIKGAYYYNNQELVLLCQRLYYVIDCSDSTKIKWESREVPGVHVKQGSGCRDVTGGRIVGVTFRK